MRESHLQSFAHSTGGRDQKNCPKAWPGSGRATGKCVTCNARLCAACQGIGESERTVGEPGRGGGVMLSYEVYTCPLCGGSGHAPVTVRIDAQGL